MRPCRLGCGSCPTADRLHEGVDGRGVYLEQSLADSYSVEVAGCNPAADGSVMDAATFGGFGEPD